MTPRFRLIEALLNRAHPANQPIPYVLATPAEAATAIEEARDKLATGTQAAVDREALRAAYTAAILAEYDHRAATRVAASPAEHAAAITDAVMTVRDTELEQARTERDALRGLIGGRDAATALDVERAMRVQAQVERGRSEKAARRLLDQRQELAAERDEWQQRGEAALARVRDSAALHRKGLISTTELYAVIGPALDDTGQPGEKPDCDHCDDTGLDPDRYTEQPDGNGGARYHADPCTECQPDADGHLDGDEPEADRA